MKHRLPDPRKLPWRAWTQRYGWRFATCLVVLGVVYGITFGWRLTPRHLPLTNAQKIAHIRNNLDVTYLYGNSIVSFKESGALAEYDLSALYTTYHQAHQQLQAGLHKAPARLKLSLKQQLQAVIDRQERVIASYGDLMAAVTQVLDYNPSTDLGLDINTKAATLITRAKAAQNGLIKATNSVVNGVQSGSFTVKAAGQVPLLSSTTNKALTHEAQCFATLTTQLGAQQYAEANSTRKRCIDDYPALRTAIITNVIQDSFAADYQQYMQTATQPLLVQLDQLIN